MLHTGIPRIQYKPYAGPTDAMCFKHYNAEEVSVAHKLNNSGMDSITFSIGIFFCKEVFLPCKNTE